MRSRSRGLGTASVLVGDFSLILPSLYLHEQSREGTNGHREHRVISALVNEIKDM